MKLEHNFAIPAPVDTVWQALLDPERVAPCFPGATITSVSGAEFAGTVKVRLGPISLQYQGAGRFTETDTAAYRTVIEASGTASGGQSTAAATVTASLAENGSGTEVTVVTTLSITGKPAQFGRGLMEEVGRKIIGRFADCLAATLGSGEPAALAPAVGAPQPQPQPQSQPAPVESAPPAAEPASTVAEPAPPAAEPAPAVAEPPSAVAEPASTVVGSASAVAGSASVATATKTAPVPTTTPPRAAPAAKPAGNAAAQRPAPPVADEIDLIDTAGGAVAKRVAPVLGALTLLAFIIRWLRNR